MDNIEEGCMLPEQERPFDSGMMTRFSDTADPIERIIAEMPRAENPVPITTCDDPHYNNWYRYMDRQIHEYFGKGAEAQCQLLAEQGYRLVPSEHEWKKWARLNLIVSRGPDYVGEQIYKQLMGNDG